MPIKLEEFVDLENFDHVRFSFTLRKRDVEPDSNDVVGVDRQEPEGNEDFYLIGLLRYLAQYYGHHLGSSLLDPLIESMAEEERVFGSDGISDEMARDLRERLEVVVLANHVRSAEAA